MRLSFSPGQETTASLLSAATAGARRTAGVQQQPARGPQPHSGLHRRIAAHGKPGKSESRIGTQGDTVAGRRHSVGTVVMVLPVRPTGPRGARTARIQTRPQEPSASTWRSHRGVHSCPGAPLARVEGESRRAILDRMSDIESVKTQLERRTDGATLRADLHHLRGSATTPHVPRARRWHRSGSDTG